MKAGAEWRDFLSLGMEPSLVFVMCEKYSTGQKINCKMYMIVLVLLLQVSAVR
jgi:hypothetical protein